MALPDRVMEIADSCLLILEEELNGNNSSKGKDKMRECLMSFVRIGVACSTETANERMDTGEIVIELNTIQQVFLGMGIYGQADRIGIHSSIASNTCFKSSLLLLYAALVYKDWLYYVFRASVW
ncbi:hypothetical protein Ddye_029556 [Dipteronia dyeriana]|uniref:Uncharacterized protein n=1 Tax=Dipteronia dyeriana TaxID=168575 RepID=A0AAD9TEN1_9ROSI|nr:hypothetical protein Ddye_029556 [Dipteronia dyeriana]